MRLSTVAAAVALLVCSAALAAPDADLAAARTLAREGRSTEAIAAATKAAEASPDDAAPGRLVQDLLLDEGRYDDLASFVPKSASQPVKDLLTARLLAPKQAETALKALLAQEGAPPQARIDLANTLLALDKVRAAEEEAAAYTALRPDDAEGHLVLGRARFATGKPLPAKEPANKALTLAPGWAPAVLLYADVVTELGLREEARLVLADALKQYPKNPALVRRLATDQMNADELEKAETTLLRLVELRSKRSGPRVLLADLQVRLGKLKEADATVRTALELDKDDPDAHRVLGLVLEKTDDFEGALEAYDEVVRLRPDRAQAHLDRGVVLTLLYAYADAQKALEKAIKLDKTLLAAHFRMGQTHYFAGDLKAAKKSLDVVLRKDANHFSANRLMGRVYLAEGKAKNAIKHFEKAAGVDPYDSDSLRMIGKCWLALGKTDKAIEAFEGALARDQSDGWVHLDLGKALEKKERFGDAEESYLKAIQFAPTKPHAHFHLARLLDEVLDSPKEALDHYQKYLDLGGDDTDGDVAGRIEQLRK